MSVGSTGRRRPRTGPYAAAIVLVALLLSGCTAAQGPAVPGTLPPDAPGPAEITASAGNSAQPVGEPGRGAPRVVIGTKDFPEQFLLGELYAQALEARGFTVTRRPNLGDTKIIDSAFAADQIQMYPEYLGEIASELAGAPAGGSPLDTYRRAQQYETDTRRDGRILLQTPYQNPDVMLVRRDLADRYGLRTVRDLTKLGAAGEGVVVAAQPPFRDRRNGLVGMQQAYGLYGVQLLAVAPGETYGALDAGQAQVADGFSTDVRVSTGDYVPLDDTDRVFGFQYVAPVVKRAITTGPSGEAFVRTCNWVSSLLDARSIRDMNRRVQMDGVDERTVAHDFLTARGLREGAR